jgi:hypothetical protein
MAGRYTTKFIQDEDQVPPGYVRLVECCSDADQKRLSGAHKRGDIRAVKLVRTESDLRAGAVWVHEGDARAYLATNGEDGRSRQQRTENCPSLERIASCLDRIATALEEAATKPRDEFSQFTAH